MTHTLQIALPPALVHEDAQRLLRLLESTGGKARFVGGCVRDALLRHVPGDIDIATSLLPEEVMALLEHHQIRVIPTGLSHGTVTAVMNHKPFEITTLRRDIECFGRHATVEYTDDFAEDAARRDFTINAMYCDKEGHIYDYYGGIEDAQKGVIRFVGKAVERVAEDFLRSLRYFRFYARFGKPPMNIEALSAISQYAPSLETLSGERIQKECLSLLSLPYLDGILETMAEAKLLQHIALPCADFKAFKELLMLEEQLSLMAHPLQRLAVLLRTAPVPLHAVRVLAERWRLSNKDKALLLQLVDIPSGFTKDLSHAEQKKILRIYGNDIFVLMVLTLWAEFLAGAVTDQQKLSPVFSQMLDLAASWQAPDFPVTGKEILALGVGEGKQVGNILKSAEIWWEEEGYSPSHQEILDYIRESLSK